MAVRPIPTRPIPAEVRKAIGSAPGLSEEWWERMLNPPKTSQIPTALPAAAPPAPEAEKRVAVTGSMLSSISYGYASSVPASDLSASAAPKPALPTRTIRWKVGGEWHKRVIPRFEKVQESPVRTVRRSKRLREEPLPADVKEVQERPSPKRRPRPNLPLLDTSFPPSRFPEAHAYPTNFIPYPSRSAAQADPTEFRHYAASAGSAHPMGFMPPAYPPGFGYYPGFAPPAYFMDTFHRR